MARGRVTRGRLIRPAPRTKIWIGGDLAIQGLGTGAATLLGSLNAAALALRPFTILRTRIEVTFRTDQTGTLESPTGAFGEIVVKETATAIGVTAVPTPLAEITADFHVFQGMTAPILVATEVGLSEPGGVRYSIDSKAMRKVGMQDDLAIIAELRAAGGASINVEGRILIQLH